MINGKPPSDELDELLGSTILKATTPPDFRPRKLTPHQLAQLNHADWLETFARVVGLPTRVEMTPRRLGTMTRLQWAADYIKLLETTIKQQENDLVQLKARLLPADTQRAGDDDQPDSDGDGSVEGR